MKSYWRDLLGEEAAEKLVAETHRTIEQLSAEELHRMMDEEILPVEKIAA